MTHDDRLKSKQVLSEPGESPKVMGRGKPFANAKGSGSQCDPERKCDKEGDAYCPCIDVTYVNCPCQNEPLPCQTLKK